MEKSLPKRKALRLAEFDYNTPGCYFITLCIRERKCILSNIVGTGVLDCPKTQLSEYGKTVDKYINQLNDFYNDISVDSYVIMPNHIHFLLQIAPTTNGQSGTPVPTGRIYNNANSKVSSFVSTLKRFCNREIGKNIWQARFYDHIIRDAEDYGVRLNYIIDNPARWREDELYNE